MLLSKRSWSHSQMRPPLLQFLIQSTQQLQVSPAVKYTALSFFADRFYPSLSEFKAGHNVAKNWLLHPIHDSRPLSVKSLKSLGDKAIKEQHFTHGDFVEAEVVLMQVLDFQIGSGNIAFVFIEELLLQLKEVAKVGELVSVEACMDIMDLLYEKETRALACSPISVAASILVASYVVTVPRQRWEFPILPWVRFVTGCKEEDILGIVREILNHVFDSS